MEAQVLTLGIIITTFGSAFIYFINHGIAARF
jgi:hypothetical protein